VVLGTGVPVRCPRFGRLERPVQSGLGSGVDRRVDPGQELVCGRDDVVADEIDVLDRQENPFWLAFLDSDRHDQSPEPTWIL
jgi:hypothetical protein